MHLAYRIAASALATAVLALPLPVRAVAYLAEDIAPAASAGKAAAEGTLFVYADEEKIQLSFMDSIPRPPLSVLIDQVGPGSDFDGVSGRLPEGLDSPADLPKITAAPMECGYSAEDCRKILGGNLVRIFREVEAVSSELQAEDRPRITDKQLFDKPRK
jgi:membrane dipeptidase